MEYELRLKIAPQDKYYTYSSLYGDAISLYLHDKGLNVQCEVKEAIDLNTIIVEVFNLSSKDEPRLLAYLQEYMNKFPKCHMYNGVYEDYLHFHRNDSLTYYPITKARVFIY